MPERRKRRTRAELLVRLGSLFFGVAALGTLAGMSSLAAWHMYEKLQVATDAADASKGQLALLVAQDAAVKSDIADLSSDRGVEAALRERYGVVRPGEGVIQIVDTPQDTASSSEASSGNIFLRIIHTVFSW